MCLVVFEDFASLCQDGACCLGKLKVIDRLSKSQDKSLPGNLGRVLASNLCYLTGESLCF